MAPVLLVPGHLNAGPGHWMSLWEGARGATRRVEMPNWEHPHQAAWTEALDDAIAACEEPPILVGHALGCMAILRWAEMRSRAVRGALLATPLDVEAPGTPEVLRDFAPIPRSTLPFLALVAASSDDPGMDLGRARALAADWGARFVDLGPRGRLDEASGHGEWPLGEALLQELS